MRIGPWWRKAPDRCPFCGEDVRFGFRWVRWTNIRRCPVLAAQPVIPAKNEATR